ncbi:MAG: hypothetical protein C0391_05085 [Anaerolinea sp.]|nr:hypothetical protein [Anaerolinea sp.]
MTTQLSPMKFEGFTSGVTRLTSLPEALFTELLPKITDIGELKVTLYAIWYVQQLEGDIRFMRLSDLRQDRLLLEAMAMENDNPVGSLVRGLGLAVERGTLLLIQKPGENESYYFVNTARSRAVVDGYHRGAWTLDDIADQSVGLDLGKPEIFNLYEQNIGMITPILAEQLKSAELDYPAGWIEEAIQEAVKNNVRKWAYIQRILETWRERGRNAKN